MTNWELERKAKAVERALRYENLIDIAIDGPAVKLSQGDALHGKHFRVQAATYGRVLFTDAIAVEMPCACTITDCIFEYM